ncbi:hypothetical protein SDRG_07372 [Saprolegnia diclina VS20]|uniref:Uncharacterized protein n=1 Tax=Saprolegnia diclina (strain VS20) TaxID=1156394 RepID=T0QB71_SAPDV|nr:hypothetical protein SDRG_07372 [Saprolegnia diclina VS20]EQC35139.1 hypothetical protein SDRG_07372 [Saprolegnia diclina VS20]|eukprot:XP_008611423.1 hypothetical protein SDRG_07372 [Saprolegnia diclina VS20]
MDPMLASAIGGMPPMAQIPQMSSMIREYANKLNKTAVEAKAKALKSSIALPALAKKPAPRLALEQQLFLLHNAHEKARVGTWDVSQAAFHDANIRMDNVNESLTYSSENIQEAIHVMKNVSRHFRELGSNMSDDLCFYKTSDKASGTEA